MTSSAVAYNANRPYTTNLWKRVQTIVGAKPDGIPGKETTSRVAAYQRTNDLPDDGKCGPLTLACMDEGPFVFENGVVVVPEGKASVNADGAPNAYSSRDSGIDFLANAGRPGNWWGVVTDDSGNPIVQRPTDPFPNHYVSTTALVNPRFPREDCRRYLDSRTVAFVALPRNLRDLLPGDSIRLGVAVDVLFQDRGVSAVFGDVGPAVLLDTDRHVTNTSNENRRLLGECSIAALLALRHDPYVFTRGLWRVRHGLSSGVRYRIGTNELSSVHRASRRVVSARALQDS